MPLAETLAGFERLQRDGKIRHHGVSNFNTEDMKRMGRRWPAARRSRRTRSSTICRRRGPEFELIPWCRERGISIMAYSPLEQGRMLNNRGLREVAQRHDATPAQVALAWLLRQDGMIVIPKATKLEHVRENRAALDLG